MIEPLKRRIFGGTPAWMYNDDCLMTGCNEQQAGPDGLKVEYCDECAEYMDHWSKLKVAVMAGDIQAYHLVECPDGCMAPRPPLIPQWPDESPPESVSCTECGTECMIAERMTSKEVKSDE